MEVLKFLIKQEAEAKHPTYNLIQQRRQDSFTEGANWMADHMVRLLEWMDRNSYIRVESNEWESDKKPGSERFTTSQLIEKYFQEQGNS